MIRFLTVLIFAALAAACSGEPIQESAAKPVESLPDSVELEPYRPTTRQMISIVADSAFEDRKAPGGFSDYGPLPRRILDDDAIADGQIVLRAKPKIRTAFQHWGGAKSEGVILVLANTTGSELAIEAADSVLPIYAQAKNEAGDWVDIEQRAQYFCGNSFHRVFLPTGYLWELAAPKYSGSFETELRFVLRLKDGSQIFSDPFAGSVEPELFTVNS